MEIFIPAVEAHVNAVAAAILSKPGMKWLVYIPDQVSDEPQCRPLLVERCVWGLEHVQYHAISLDHAVAQFAIALLVVGVRVPGEVDEVVRVHVRNLPDLLCRATLMRRLAQVRHVR